MPIQFSRLRTSQDWIDLAEELITASRDAAKAGDMEGLESAADDCSAFVSKATSKCPDEAANTVFQVQVELRQLIVSNLVGSIKERTAQLEAYLQDIRRISDKAVKAADLISFKSATEIVGRITDIVDDVKTAKRQLDEGDSKAAGKTIDAIADNLKEIHSDFQNLGA